MLEFLKDSIQLTHFFGFGFLLLALATYYFTFSKTRWYWFLFVFLFLLASTQIFPAYLMAKYEAKTPVCHPSQLKKNEIYYLHVLGAGYSLDSNLPATGQLNTTTLTRLIEAIRISRQLTNYKLVTSAYSSLGLESQASVAKRAAISLGIPSQNITMLTSPSNTSEEVAAFVKHFGTQKKVIVVSDALHLPRALMLYKKAGVTAIGAPTNFYIKNSPIDYHGLTFPSLRSIALMNSYLREQLKYWKDDNLFF
jgi:uncharacterized SAM-binding protein YcdF (DUF218 family)